MIMPWERMEIMELGRLGIVALVFFGTLFALMLSGFASHYLF
jgi:hypothetical protein